MDVASKALQVRSEVADFFAECSQVAVRTRPGISRSVIRGVRQSLVIYDGHVHVEFVAVVVKHIAA